MNSKTLVKNSAARIEAELLNDEVTEIDYLATRVINPSQSVVGKDVIINLPTDTDYKIVTKRNKVVSRFPIKCDEDLKYEIIPYPENEKSNDHSFKPYSLMILNRWMMLDPNYIVTINDNYLLGIDPMIDEHLTVIGYLIDKTIKS